MNLQPYRMIIVRDSDRKDALADCMSQKNILKIRNSGASSIICSDMGTLLSSVSCIESEKCVEDFGKFAYKEEWKEKCGRIIQYCISRFLQLINSKGKVL